MISFFLLIVIKGGNSSLRYVMTLSYELAVLYSMKISLGIPITKNFMETYKDELLLLFFFLLIVGLAAVASLKFYYMNFLPCTLQKSVYLARQNFYSPVHS
jgi:hypothetical protein